MATSSGRGTKLHSGKWTHEESEYVRELIKEFEAGSLNIEENISLRAFLSKALNCSPKRISKKFEGTSYNGKQLYKRKTSVLTPQEVVERRGRLHDLECKYQESLRVLEMVEASRKPSFVAGQGNILNLKRPLLNPIGAVVGEPAAGLGLVPAGISREARMAQLQADIALASMALQSQTSSAAVSAGLVVPRRSSLVERSSQSEILAALSQTRSFQRDSSTNEAQTFQGQLALNQYLLGGSLPTEFSSLRSTNSMNYPFQQQLKRGMETAQAGAKKRSKLA